MATDINAPTEQELAELLAELRKAAAAALRDWFEAGVQAGLDPMLMAGQLSADMQELLG